MVSPQDDMMPISGDPIQQLFATLGKFQRHLHTAQHMPDGGDWCDACMDELETGLEIALACDWTPVKDALIDTARILHSYERVRQPGLCLPFLKDSYEILSLMVGDLIVDTVRMGVKQKWRDHYMKAVEELDSRGITLIEDEGAEPDTAEEAYSEPFETVSEDSDESAPYQAPPADDWASSDTVDHASFEDAPVVADVNTVDRGEEETIMEETEPPPFELPPLSDDEIGMEATRPDHMAEEAELVPFPGASSSDLSTDEVLQEEEGIEGDVSVAEEGDGQQSENAAPSLEHEPDTLESAFLTPDEPPEDSSIEEATMSSSAAVNPPSDLAVNSAIETHGAMEPEQSQEVDTSPSVPETSEKMPIIAEPSSSEGVHDGGDASDIDAYGDEPPQEDDVESQDDTGPNALLRRAHAAMRKGDIANAKTVALELAVAMARMEYEQAQRQLAQSEQQLVTNAKDIEQAEAAVEATEQELSRTEELLAARDSESSACRERIGMIDEELGVLSSELSDIDAEIAALQKKRAEQVNRLENKREEREEAIDSEGRLQTEMESLTQETEAVRTRLNTAHEHTHNKQEERRKIVAAIHMAREASESQRLSLLAIERTLGADEGADIVGNDDEETLL